MKYKYYKVFMEFILEEEVGSGNSIVYELLKLHLLIKNIRILEGRFKWMKNLLKMKKF